MSANPVLIEVTRGAAVESRHRGSFVVVDASGKIVHSAGDPHMPVYPRSAVKPLQAIPLIETGAADRFGLTDRELALACASHKGEPAHVKAVETWLARIGLSPAALECGIQAPRTPDAAKSAILAGAPLNAAYPQLLRQTHRISYRLRGLRRQPVRLYRTRSSGAEAGDASARGDDRVRSERRPDWP